MYFHIFYGYNITSILIVMRYFTALQQKVIYCSDIITFMMLYFQHRWSMSSMELQNKTKGHPVLKCTFPMVDFGWYVMFHSFLLCSSQSSSGSQQSWRMCRYEWQFSHAAQSFEDRRFFPVTQQNPLGADGFSIDSSDSVRSCWGFFHSSVTTCSWFPKDG